MTLRFTQVDVFSREPFRGNPVAVVHDAADVGDADMAAFARWTNLSETTFLLPPTVAEADYRLRIFTPGGELPFAGHPTLGSARAWLEAGGRPHDEDTLVQECGVGLVRIRRSGDDLAFAAPPLRRSGEVDPATLAQVGAALGLDPGEIRDANWVDNGPGWLGLLLHDADTVLRLRPDMSALGGHKVGVIGPHPTPSADAPGGPADVEVRAFVPSLGVPEDPVTGSLNAGLAVWLVGAGILPQEYVAAQGTVLGRAGRVSIAAADGEIWVGGRARPLVTGTVELGSVS